MKYVIVVEEGDSSFGAYAPDIPGCGAVGKTREEAIELVKEAIKLHLVSLREHGEDIPEPASQFFDSESVFGKDFLSDRDDPPAQKRDFS